MISECETGEKEDTDFLFLIIWTFYKFITFEKGKT